MKKLAIATILTAALLLLAGPVMAGQPIDTVSDEFDPNSGYGIALLWHGGNVYEYIWYIDDGDGVYSEGDKVIRSQFVRLLPL